MTARGALVRPQGDANGAFVDYVLCKAFAPAGDPSPPPIGCMPGAGNFFSSCLDTVVATAGGATAPHGGDWQPHVVALRTSAMGTSGESPVRMYIADSDEPRCHQLARAADASFWTGGSGLPSVSAFIKGALQRTSTGDFVTSARANAQRPQKRRRKR